MSAPLELLRMEGVRKRFGATVALDGVDLTVHAGEVLALVGENGAGKSTLMKVLSGAHKPDSGKLWLAGEPYNPADPLTARRAGVSMIYQELSLAQHLSVMENITLGMEPRRGPLVDWPEVRRRAVAALAQLGREDLAPETLVSKLSLAEQQLVEIARALAVGCRVLVLDEPSSSLGKQDLERLFALVRRLKSQGLGIIYISHFLEEVRALSDRFLVLRDGRSVATGATAETPNETIIASMVGRPVEDLYPRSPREAAAEILELSNLAGVSKPVDASLTLHRGEVLGIAGIIGAGRTEMLRALFGLAAVKGGSIKFGTFNGAATPGERWTQGMGMVSENRKEEGLALNLSIAENLTLSNLPKLLLPATQQAKSAPWIEQLGIRCAGPGQAVGQLSGGNQQKVALARLLHHDVDVLLLNEPTRGIDVAAKALIYQWIDRLACEGKAILLVSSYLPELLGVCDRIAVMSKGKLSPALPASQLTEHQIMELATAGVS